MGESPPTAEALRAEHARLGDEVRRMNELVAQLENDEGFDELDRLAQVMKADLDHHFPRQAKAARAVFGEQDEAYTELVRQHENLTTHYRTLLAMIQDIRDDMLVDREQFMKTVRAVTTQLRAHLEAEKRLLLPRLGEG